MCCCCRCCIDNYEKRREIRARSHVVANSKERPTIVGWADTDHAQCDRSSRHQQHRDATILRCKLSLYFNSTLLEIIKLIQNDSRVSSQKCSSSSSNEPTRPCRSTSTEARPHSPSSTKAAWSWPWTRAPPPAPTSPRRPSRRWSRSTRTCWAPWPAVRPTVNSGSACWPNSAASTSSGTRSAYRWPAPPSYSPTWSTRTRTWVCPWAPWLPAGTNE